MTSLKYNTNYVFEVLVVNDQGLSPESSVSVTTEGHPVGVPAVGVPDAPPRLTAISGDTVVILSWDVPNYKGGSPIIEYQYQQKEGSGNFVEDWKDIDESAVGEDHETSFVVDSLTNGTAYTFQVRAVNGEHKSEPSSLATATPTEEATAPSPPTSLRVTEGDTRASLSWTASLSDGGSVITEHQYRKRNLTESGGWEDWVPISNNSAPGETHATAYTVMGLTNGVEYSFQVMAVNNIGFSEPSSAISVTPNPPLIPPTVPDAPASLMASASSTEVTLSWTPSDDGRSAITGHKYKKKVGSGTWESSWTDILKSAFGEAHAKGYSVTTGLANDTEYSFQVIAVNDIGESAPSNIASATPTSGAQTPLPPRNLDVDPGHEKVTLNWDVSLSDRGSTITGYEYRYKVTAAVSPWDDNSWTPIDSSAPGESYETRHEVSSLTNDTEYSFQVRAVNGVGESEASNTEKATPSRSTILPSAPIRLLGEAGDTKAILSWTASVRDGGSSITEHKYQQKEGSGGFGGWIPIGLSAAPDETHATKFTVLGLTNGVLYTFQVQAINQNGGGPESNPIEVRPVTVPDAPTRLAASAGDIQQSL